MSNCFKFLAVVGAAMFAGVMLAIGVILGNFWKSLPPGDFLNWFSQYSPLILPAIYLVVVPTLAGFAGALWFDWRQANKRALWLTGLMCVIAVQVFTMAYFLPANAAFSAKAIALQDVPHKLDTWVALHYIRIALAMAASVLGIAALQKRDQA